MSGNEFVRYEDIKIYELTEADTIPYPLLLLADPSRDLIDQYIPISKIYCAEYNQQQVACYVLVALNKQEAEIKNIAVAESFQGKGIGKILLSDAINRSRLLGYSRLKIGTGNSSLGQLRLYQKIGFRIVEIKKDYFTEHYDQPIIENGMVCRHMIVLSLDL